MRSILWRWLKAMRAPFFAASMIPVLVGAALAFHGGRLQWDALGYGLLIVLSSHAGANLLNDYYDAHGSDKLNQSPTPFSGGSRVIQDGLLTRKHCLYGSLLAYGISGFTALILAIFEENILIFLITFAGILLGVGYSCRWAYGMGRGWGEVAIGLSFGPLAVMGSYLLHTGDISEASILAGIPVGFLIMGVLVLNEIPDYPADLAAGKRNWVVRSGGGYRGVWIYLALIVLAYLTILGGVFLHILPIRVLISYSTIPLAIWIVIKIYQCRLQTPGMIPAMAGNIGLTLLTGILLSLGLCLQ